jgi:hypothetical protein
VSREVQNLLIPFRRDKKRDFAVGSGEALLASKVRQALLTEGATARSSGELPWRTNFARGWPCCATSETTPPSRSWRTSTCATRSRGGCPALSS